MLFNYSHFGHEAHNLIIKSKIKNEYYILIILMLYKLTYIYEDWQNIFNSKCCQILSKKTDNCNNYLCIYKIYSKTCLKD